MKRPSREEGISIFLATPWMQNAFWARVKLAPGCWGWRGAKAAGGYGVYAVKKTLVLAHRLSYAYWYQALPGSLFVCHRCDNPGCTNPEHLFLGDVGANNADRHAKGRSRGGIPTWRGESAPGARLTERQVISIRAASADGALQADLAAAHGVKPNTINGIVNRKTWSHLP